MHKLVATLGVAALAATSASLVAGCGSSGSSDSSSNSSQATTGASTTPPAVPSRFAAEVSNPWFPLKPGTTLTYRGVKDGKPSRDVFAVTRATKVIEGVRTTVVSDRLYAAGKLAERTLDYYAQDEAGNVWYFGEDTAELDPSGKVTSTSGTWRAGVKGARAGIFMPADPRPGQSGQQEFYKGEAEDRFRVVSVSTPVRTPGASTSRGLLTAEWTPLEPGVLDHKLYVRGVGTALEQTVKGGDERNTLVAVTRP
jgi:hypothetical protein